MGPRTAVFAKISTARPQASGRLTACVSARELRESLGFLGPCADAVSWWVLAKQWSAELVKHCASTFSGEHPHGGIIEAPN